MLKKANINDLKFLYDLECEAFDETQRVSKLSIKHSILSNRQEVIIYINEHNYEVGSYTILHYKNLIRIYSIAVLKKYSNQGYGKILLEDIIQKANNLNKDIILEYDASNEKLQSFYEKYGFIKLFEIKDYYGINKNAIKMIKKIEKEDKLFNSLIIVDKDISWLSKVNAKILNTNEFIENDLYSNYRSKIINLCDSYKIDSTGYYVSLLASARDQFIIPSVATISDFKRKKIQQSISYEINEIIQEKLNNLNYNKISFNVFLGYTKNGKLSILAKSIFDLYEIPFFEVEFIKENEWILNQINPISLDKIKDEDQDFVINSLNKYIAKRGLKHHILKNYIYDLAILIDNEEKTPPSNEKALKLFKKAADNVGFYTEFITKKDFKRLNEFDALFIRTTTNVFDYTYEFSRYAYSEGLVVIDDPWSILKCSNKIFLYEKLRKNNILMPNTKIINQNTFKITKHKNLQFPVIIKEPSSSFSKGVFKINTLDELNKVAINLFKKSQLLIIQEYLQSEYDWRIGVLNNEIIYACKYYMAKDHWQIINWSTNQDGDFNTFNIKDVPKKVKDIALKSTSLIGNGLYGVDIKLINDIPYIIEINDNPNIDHGIEDLVGGFEIYEKIINYLFTSIDRERNINRYISK